MAVPINSIIYLDSNSRAICVGICILFFALSQIFSPAKKINFHSVDAWWFILIVYSGLSSLWSINGSYAIYGMFMTILIYCCYAAYQSSEIKSEHNIDFIFWTAFTSFSVILLSLSASLINYIAAENLSGVSKSKYAGIIFRNCDLLTSIAFLIAPYIAFTDKKVHRLLAPVLFVLMSITFLAIQPLKATLLIAFLVLIYILFNANLSQINKYIILGASILVLFLGLVYGPVNMIVTASQTTHTKESVDQKERIQLWKNSIELAKESILFGHGKNNWELAITKYGYTSEEQKKPFIYPKTHTHSFNVASQLLAELGIVGIIAFIYIMILPCFRLINERSILDKLEVAALISIVISFILGLIYGSPLNYYKNLQGPVIIAFIGLGIVSTKSNKSTMLYSTNQKWLNLILLIGAVISIIYFGRINHAEKLQARAIQANLNNNFSAAEKQAKKALKILPESKSYQILFQSLISQEKYKEAKVVIHEAVKKDSFNISLLYMYGEQLLKTGDIATAKICSDKIDKIAPHYLYNAVLASKINLIEAPSSNAYQSLITLRNDLRNFKQFRGQHFYVPKLLYPKYIVSEIDKFLIVHNAKVHKN